MISCAEFVGRLGNHLFQMSAAIGVAIEHGDAYGFPRWVHEGDFPLGGCFHERIDGGPEYREPAFSYSPVPYWPNLRLRGYFQSEKYFSHCASRIRELFTPLRQARFPRQERTAAVHVRRGDYLLLPDKHPVLPLEYYREAMAVLRKRGISRFLVMSDDLPWCRARRWGPGVEVIGDLDALDQFALTISCRGHAMANSTFSWWGAWLGPDPEKAVVAPKRWFGPGYAHFDTKDLIPEGWTIL